MAKNERSGADLTAQQRRAVQLLCTEQTLASVAKQAGIGEATLRRWRRKPEFRAALRRALDEAFSDGTRLLTADQLRNLTELVSLRSKSDDPAIRLRAGLGLESALVRRHELLLLTDLAQRVDALEQADDEADAGAAGEQD